MLNFSNIATIISSGTVSLEEALQLVNDEIDLSTFSLPAGGVPHDNE